MCAPLISRCSRGLRLRFFKDQPLLLSTWYLSSISIDFRTKLKIIRHSLHSPELIHHAKIKSRWWLLPYFIRPRAWRRWHWRHSISSHESWLNRILWQIIPYIPRTTYDAVYRSQTIKHRQFINVDSLVTHSVLATSHHCILNTPGACKRRQLRTIRQGRICGNWGRYQWALQNLYVLFVQWASIVQTANK